VVDGAAGKPDEKLVVTELDVREDLRRRGGEAAFAMWVLLHTMYSHHQLRVEIAMSQNTKPRRWRCGGKEEFVARETRNTAAEIRRVDATLWAVVST